MRKKLISAIAAGTLLTAAGLYADAQPANNQKNPEPKPQANTVKSTEPQMPKMPEIDQKIWDFIPAVVAEVGNQKITKDQLVRALNPQARMMVMMGQKLDNKKAEELAKNMTDELVKATILENMAVNAGYKVTPAMEDEVFNKFLDNIKKQMPAGQKFDFEDIIKKQGLTVAEVKKQMAEGEIIQNWIKEKVTPEIKISDKDVTDFYNTNKDKYFETPETVTASHILIKPVQEVDGKKVSEEESFTLAKTEADKIYKTIEDFNAKTTEANKGKPASVVTSLLEKNFAELAKKDSEGPSAKDGGSLGSFAKGQMVPAFQNEAWKLAESKTLPAYGMVQTQFGWHIIEVTALNKGGVITLDKQLEEQIKEQLTQQAIGQKLQDIIAEQMKVQKPQIFLK